MKCNLSLHLTLQSKSIFQNKFVIRSFSSNSSEKVCVECGDNPFANEVMRRIEENPPLSEETKAFMYKHLHILTETTCKVLWPHGLSKESLQKDYGMHYSELYNRYVTKINNDSLNHPCTVDIYPYYSYNDTFYVDFYKTMEHYEYFFRCIQLGELENSGTEPVPYVSVLENDIILYYHKFYFDFELFGIKFDEKASWLWGSLHPKKIYELFSFPWGFESLTFQAYFPILVFMFLAVFLASLIVSASYLLATQAPESEKLSTYECGFEPYEDAKNKFDVQFYIVALLFVLFDIEIILLSPWCLSLASLDLLGYWAVIEFLLELGLGLIYVFCMGGLDWHKQTV